MPRGGKQQHKGKKRQFTNPCELEQQRQKEERERQWRRERGEESEEEVESEKEASSGSAASSEHETDSDEEPKKKGVEGLIAVENPNRLVRKQKKVSELTTTTGMEKIELSRREREELEKQKARAHYQKLHDAGKTDEARADLARLAIIRKQREEAAKKRDEDKKVKEAVVKQKQESTAKALGKKKS